MAAELSFPRHPVALAALAWSVVFGAPCMAQTQPLRAASEPARLDSGTLEVPLRKSKVVSVDRPIAKAMVGSDEIADVLPLTDRAIYVLGKKMGTTSLTLYDAGGRVLSVMNVAVGPDVDSLQAQMRAMIPGENIDATISNESIVLSGLVGSSDAASRAMMLAKTFAGDKVVNMISIGASQQVMLEVRFAEVSRNVGKDIGVRNSVSSRTGAFGAAVGQGSSAAGGTTQTNSIATNGVTNNLSNNRSITATNNNSTSVANGVTGVTNNSTTNSTLNSGTVTTNQGLSGVTPPFSGSVADFTNLGTLVGKTFTGTGYAGVGQGSGSAGADGSTISNATSTTSSTTANGTSSSASDSASTNAIGSMTTALAGAVANSLVSTTNTLGSLLQLGNVTNSFGIFQQRFSIGGLTIQSMLNAMETRGEAKTLAQPTLMALSGEKASFLAGGEFPIPVAPVSYTHLTLPTNREV